MPTPASFDHDEARRLRATEGLTYREIAARLGVSKSRIHQVCEGHVRSRREINEELRRRGPGPLATASGVQPRKISDDQVREMRARYAAGGVTQVDLAKEFGLSEAGARQIIRGHKRRFVV